MFLFFIFLLGVAIGSFLNVVGLRWNSGIDLGGRSFCPVCRKQLVWWELVPLFSFVLLRGRCSQCKSKISWQYPLIELWTGLIFISIYLRLLPFDFSIWNIITFVLYAKIFSLFVVIVIYDLRHKIIPDFLVFSSIGAGLFMQLLLGNFTMIDWLAGPIIFSFFGLIWLLSRGRAMGFGDAKLGLSVGLLLGAAQGFSAILLSFWIGSLVTLSYMGVTKLISPLSNRGSSLTMKSEIPFAPFIILAAWISFIFKLDILNVLLF